MIARPPVDRPPLQRSSQMMDTRRCDKPSRDRTGADGRLFLRTAGRQSRFRTPLPTRCVPRFNSDRRAARALTLVEIMLVMVIIGILASAILVATGSVLDRAHANNTLAVLQVVHDAVEEFRRERPPMLSARHPAQNAMKKATYTYKQRFGSYPPDELEAFDENGLTVWNRGNRGDKSWSLAPGGAQIVPAPDYGPMHFDLGHAGDPQPEHRDQLAMVIAIETTGGTSAGILAQIPDRNRRSVPVDAEGRPTIFLDHNDNGDWDPEEDEQFRYIVDDWGAPISYYAQRDWNRGLKDGAKQALASSNHPMWNEASTRFISANDGAPLIMSYGPNGKDQLTADIMDKGDGPEAAGSIHGDYADDPDRTINNPLNQDNVYLNPNVAARLAEGFNDAS